MPDKIFSYKDLRVFQNAMEAAMKVYNLTKKFPAEEKYALTAQMRGTTRSVCTGLSEAWRKRQAHALRLDGHVAIITGAAQGIGAQYAKALAGEGAKICVSDILDTAAVVGEIKAAGGEAIGLTTDVSKPDQCEAFGTLCTPEQPLGAPMVSSEGACAAYYNYGRFKRAQPTGGAV